MRGRTGLKISKRSVDLLSVEDGDGVFWDRDLPGFGVRVYASGHKAYVVQTRGPGGSKRITLGRHGTLTADQARRKAAEVIDRIKQGDDPLPAPPEAALTVAELAQRYLDAHAAVSCTAHTASLYRGSLRNHILPALGTMPLGAVGREQVSALHFELRDTPGAANRALKVLSKMYSLAEAWGLTPVGSNPCRFVVTYKEGKRERFLSAGRVPASGSVTGRPGSRAKSARACGGGTPAAHADRMPAQRNPDPALGRCGPEGRRAAPARRQDRRPHGAADAHGGSRAGRHSPCAGQSLGVCRGEAGRAPVPPLHVLVPRQGQSRPGRCPNARFAPLLCQPGARSG